MTREEGQHDVGHTHTRARTQKIYNKDIFQAVIVRVVEIMLLSPRVSKRL